MQLARCVGEVLDGDVRDAEQRPGRQAEQQPLGALQDELVAGDRDERGANREDPHSTLISGASEECYGFVAPPPVSPITTSPAAVIVTPIHCHRPRRKPK